MDVERLFVKIETLEDYIEVTKNVSGKYKNFKVQLNMSTVLSLKKARYLEIEYFNKCNGHGAAFIIIGRLLEVSRSKTWGLLGKELVSLLQHWLDTARKHLIILNTNWWSFLNLLLKFIMELRLKDTILPDMLVENTAEYLLDLATRSEPDILQRLDILYCLNLCCADSSREVRFATRHRLENHFVKLSSLLAKSGHVPTQYYMLETLLRWLLPRQNSSVRQAACAKWFPDSLYGREAVDVFLERTWQNFFLDARDFLNAYNQSQGLATSAIYHQISIGSLTMECSSRRDSWIDINPSSRSITVLLEPRMMEILGVAGSTMHALVVSEDHVLDVKLGRETSNVTLVIKTSHPLLVYPSKQTVGDGGDVTVLVSKRNDFRRLDHALRDVFREKYEVLIDFEELTITSPRDRNKKIFSSSEEDTRFSHPVRPTRRKASGYVTKSATTWKSPSTTSTTSLALLHDRLEALPKFRYNKEPTKVAALPDLSIVSELTETNDSQSVTSGTSTIRPYGIGFKSLRKSEKKSQSVGEKYKSKKYISPIVGVKEHNTSCLLVATIGSNETVINETIESLSKNKDFEADNIVDLLLKEALQSKDDKLDSGIKTGENRKSPDLRNNDAIENTPDIEQNKSTRSKLIQKEDTSEECNEIDESQFEYVSVRKKVLIDKHKEIEEDIQKGIDANGIPTFEQEAVEKFFSEHIAEDRSGAVVVSPTLARKINETSSEGTVDLQDCLIEEDFPNVQDIHDVEIIDCLNNIIDKVCHDFEKCAKILERDQLGLDILKMAEKEKVNNKENVPIQDLTNIQNLDSEKKRDVVTPKKKSKPKNVIKLKFKTKKLLNKTRSQKHKLDLASKMSPIPENKDSVEPEIPEKNDIEPPIIENINNRKANEVDDNVPVEIADKPSEETAAVSPEINNISPKSDDLATPLIRRRRKLYSPKDEHNKNYTQNEKVENDELEVHDLRDDDGADFRSDCKKTRKYAATCYKDIEQVRKKNIRLPRSKKSRARKDRSPSPRTKKMNELFDNLKTNVEKHDDIILADKKFNNEELAIYNFTSDSEDEDFKKKKVEMKKRVSTTTNASGDSTVSRHGRLINKVNYSEKSSDERTKKTNSKNVVRRKKARQRRPFNLADEKMRDAQHEDLNSSFVFKKDNKVTEDPDPILKEPPQMEVMTSELDEPVKVVPRTKKPAKKKKINETKKIIEQNIDKKMDNDDRTLSPLPGLVIEKMPPRKDDLNDSVSTQIMNNLKKIYNEGPDAVDESNTTQNLLLDNEKLDFSQHLHFPKEFAKSPPITNIVKDTNDIKSNTRKNSDVLNDEENIIEVINIDDSKDKKRHRRDKKVVNISISDEQFEKSIATVGKSPITGHGDMDEEPPDNGHLNKRVQSRYLETEDMDTSIKDYYLQLREELNKSLNSSSSSKQTELSKKRIKTSQKCISPVVQMRKMSEDDISKWLPVNDSGKNNIDLLEKISVNISQKSISPVVSLNKISYEDKNKSIPTNNILEKAKIDLVESSSGISSRKCISPVVSLYKMSYDDISKWLPSRRNSYESSARSSEKTVVIETIKNGNDNISETSVFLRPLPNKKSRDEQYNDLRGKNSKEMSSKSSANKEITNDNETTSKQNKNQHNNKKSVPKSISSIKIISDYDCNNNDYNSTTKLRKSLISPIKLFEDLPDSNNNHSIPDEKCEAQNEPIIQSPVLNISAKKRYDLRKSTLKISSDESNISSSTRVDGKTSIRSTFKRKSGSPVKEYAKKRRIEVLTESGPSVSSVDDWLKKSAPISAAKSLSDSYGESLQNIMERLDTTLAEIHQITSKNFVHLFVSAQRQLSAARSERRRVLQQVAGDVLQEVAAIIDRNFEDFEKRSQEMDTEFMEQLKSRATEFIREDCKKKRVMVAIIKDDIQAVVNQSRGQDSQ